MAKKDFKYYKNWALKVIQEQIKELDKEEEKDKKVAKAFFLAEKELKKSFAPGTIRTWKGKKFIKGSDKKWRPYYEKHDTTGAKRTLSLLAKKINALEDGDFEGLYNLLKLHKDRFQGKGNQLMEIYKLAKEKGANVGRRFKSAKDREKRKKTVEELAKKYNLTHPTVDKKEEPKEKEKKETKKESEKEEKPKNEPPKESNKNQAQDVNYEDENYKARDEMYKRKWDHIGDDIKYEDLTEYKGGGDAYKVYHMLRRNVDVEDIEKAFEGLSEEDSKILLSWIKREAKISKVEKHHLWVEHAFDVFTRKKDSKDGWSVASLKNKYEHESKTLRLIKFSEQCIRQAWGSPTEIISHWDEKTQTDVYEAYGNMGAVMDNGYMEKFDQRETTHDIVTGYTAIPFGTFTKKELAQFERIKPRFAAIKRKIGDKAIELHEDTKKFLKALYDAKVKDPNFKAYHDYTDFSYWQTYGNLSSNEEVMTEDEKISEVLSGTNGHLHRWEKDKLRRRYGNIGFRRSWCFFDKEGHLWFRKSAFREHDFAYFKKRAISCLKKQYKELEKEEKENKNITKAFAMAEIEIEKAFPVGTIREWKGKKFIKSPDKKWRPYYENHKMRGEKLALAALAKKINALQDGDYEGLYKLLTLHRSRFTSDKSLIKDLYDAMKERGALGSGRFSKKEGAKTEKKEQPKVEVKTEKKKEKVKAKLEKESKKKEEVEEPKEIETEEVKESKEEKKELEEVWKSNVLSESEQQAMKDLNEVFKKEEIAIKNEQYGGTLIVELGYPLKSDGGMTGLTNMLYSVFWNKNPPFDVYRAGAFLEMAFEKMRLDPSNKEIVELITSTDYESENNTYVTGAMLRYESRDAKALQDKTERLQKSNDSGTLLFLDNVQKLLEVEEKASMARHEAKIRKWFEGYKKRTHSICVEDGKSDLEKNSDYKIKRDFASFTKSLKGEGVEESPEEIMNEICDLVDNCNSDIAKKVFERFLKKVYIEDTNYKGTARFDNGLNGIFFNLYKTMHPARLSTKTRYETLLHEVSHAIDYNVQPDFEHLSSRAYQKVKQEDGTEKVMCFADVLRQDVLEYIKKSTLRIEKEFNDIAKKIKDNSPEQRDEFIKKLDKKGFFRVDTKKKKFYRNNPDVEIKLDERMVRNKIGKELEIMNGKDEGGNLSDIIEGVTADDYLGVVFGNIGHADPESRARRENSGYWDRDSIAEEAFAEMFSALITHKDEFERMKEVFPNGVDFFGKILKSMLNCK